MEHFSHKHPLNLNEVYIAKEGDVCRVCNEEIVSCRSFVYSCSGSCSSPNSTSSSDDTSADDPRCDEFLLHKRCAELPPTIRSPSNDQVSLDLSIFQDRYLPDEIYYYRCSICGCEIIRSRFTYMSIQQHVLVCVRCAMSSLEDICINQHPVHPQHTLKFVQHLSSFRCYACKVDDGIRDLSYICTKCPFWIHKSCADAPNSFQFQFHDKHPLILSFSLPEVYQNFAQHCRFCNKKLCRTHWLYYCPKCRFFVHFHCARSNQMKSLIEDEIYDSDVEHLPAADESSADQLAEQFVMAMSTLSTTNCLRHWAHDDHDLQLMTINELNDQIHDETLLCDGCVKPIRTDHHDSHFYGCVPCNYFLHRACAGLPREIKQHQLPLGRYAHPYNSPLFFNCDGCGVVTNGIFFSKSYSSYSTIHHIGCLTLPKKIKHEAHSHQLNEAVSTGSRMCKACGRLQFHEFKHWCKKCDYSVCKACIMKPRTVKHKWDRHPLSLIYDPGMVSDHEHEFYCEYCSGEINTNFWFYHCSDCDLSFHFQDCIDISRHRQYSHIKFGYVIYLHKLHHHSLTFILNKKFGSCVRCHWSGVNFLALECAPCKMIFCLSCWDTHLC